MEAHDDYDLPEIFVLPNNFDITLPENATLLDDEAINQTRSQLLEQLTLQYPELATEERFNILNRLLPAIIQKVNEELFFRGGHKEDGSVIPIGLVEEIRPTDPNG